MQKNPALTGRTRENLIQAFWDCYGKKPLPEVTVKDVTQAAGYNRSTFYQYFDNIPDLLAQAEEELLRRFGDITNAAIEDGFSMTSMEKTLRYCFDECGRELEILLGPRGDVAFLARFKDLIKPIAAADRRLRADSDSLELLSEFASADFLCALAYISSHPDKDWKWVVHQFHAYIDGGAPGMFAPV